MLRTDAGLEKSRPMRFRHAVRDRVLRGFGMSRKAESCLLRSGCAWFMGENTKGRTGVAGKRGTGEALSGDEEGRSLSAAVCGKAPAGGSMDSIKGG